MNPYAAFFLGLWAGAFLMTLFILWALASGKLRLSGGDGESK